VVEVSVGGDGELEGPEADVVERLVIDTERLVRVLDELVDGEGGVVGLNDGVGDLIRCRQYQCEDTREWDAPWGRERRRRWPSFGRGTPP
jgi:hypothetical protein